MPSAAPPAPRRIGTAVVLASGILSAIATGGGNGDGEPDLQAARLGTRYLQLAVADLDGDSLADVAALSSTPGSVSGDLTALELFLRDPNDPATLVVTKAADTEDALGTALLADIDLDERMDAVMTEPAERGVRILRGFDASAGTFGSEVILTLRSEPGAAAIADIDLDGLPDLLFATAVGVTARLQDSNAPGRFTAERSIDDSLDPQLSGATGLDTLAAADISGNGLVDLLTARGDGGRRYDQLAGVPGSFAAPVPLPFVGIPESLAAHDLNGDDQVDVLGGGSSRVEVLLQQTGTPGAFEPSLTLATVEGAASRFIAVADLNDDGLPDLAVGNAAPARAASTLQIFLQTPADFGFEPSGTYAIPGSADLDAALSGLRAGDVNGDGLTDLTATQREMFVFVNDAADPGRFADGVQISGSQGVPLP